MEIDIRGHSKEEIKQIRFGENSFDIIEHSEGRIFIAKEDNGLVMIEDIDNLILALLKAKELWS